MSSTRAAGHYNGGGDQGSAGRSLVKIGLVSPYDLAYPGGVTAHVAHLAEELQRTGHEVHLIVPGG